MPQAVVEAMVEASRVFVSVDGLLEKAGKRIAQLTGNEAAYVTSGAAAGLAIAAAACMAGADAAKALQLPDISGLKDEFIMLRCHRIHYDQAIRLAGGRIVDVGFADWSTPSQIEVALSDRTAGILYTAKAETVTGSLPLSEVIRVASGANVPVIVDAADELPPCSNLCRFTNAGVDLAIFSGGKDIRGPQASGLVLGRRDLIEACSCHANPRHGIGRPMKAGKEEIVGLVKAVELYVQQDFEAEMNVWKERADYFRESLQGIPHIWVYTERAPIPGEPGSFRLPAAYVDIDEEGLGKAKDLVVKELLAGDPAIAVGQTSTGIVLRSQMLQSGEEKLVAHRVKEVLLVKSWGRSSVLGGSHCSRYGTH